MFSVYNLYGSIVTVGNRKIGGIRVKKSLPFVLTLALIAAVAMPGWAESVLPEALVTIEEGAFENDEDLTGLWVCPQNVETIGADAFSGTNLFALDVNGGAVSVAAQQLNSAAYIRLRGAQTQVDGLSGMRYMIGVEDSAAAVWASDNEVFFVPEDELVEEDGFYYQASEDGLTLLSAMDALAVGGSVMIPTGIGEASVIGISDYAFMGCTDLGLIWLPDALQDSVNPEAMADCPEAAVVYYHDSDYPEVIPGIDFCGAEALILDYWSGDGSEYEDDDYLAWINEAYNVRLHIRQGGDWGTCAQEMIDFNSEPDDSLRIYIIEPGKVGSLVANGVAAPLNGKYVNLTADKWNAAERKFMTIGGKIYGCYPGKSTPRGCLFFNKRVLEEAGIDWNTIYDLQAEGKWTWAAFEEMLAQITRDTDNDGVYDIWGMLGSGDDAYVLSVFSNGGCFFDFNENGEIYPAMNSSETLEALTWFKDIQSKYFAPTPEGANWDWYKDAWKTGKYGFYVYQTYGGFNDNSEMADMADDWGCVAWPVPNEGDTYINVISDNITMIPACYDSETVARLLLLYDLWTGGEDDGYGWIGNKLNYTDRRAVMETYAMLREAEHCRVNKVLYLGTQNDVIGSSLLWSLGGSTPTELIEAAMPTWQALCDAFNNK